MIGLTVDCISDGTLRETAFKVYLKRVALLLTSGGEVSTEAAEQHLEYAVQVLWELHMRSGHQLNKKFANYVSSESQLVSSTLKVICTCLETYGRCIILSDVLHCTFQVSSGECMAVIGV